MPKSKVLVGKEGSAQ